MAESKARSRKMNQTKNDNAQKRKKKEYIKVDTTSCMISIEANVFKPKDLGIGHGRSHTLLICRFELERLNLRGF